MIRLVTVEAARTHLRVTTHDREADIEMKVDQASAIIMNYLKLTALPEDWTDTSTSPVTNNIPQDIQAATLLGVGELYYNREASATGSFVGSVGVLSTAVLSLLHRHRDPALA